MSEVKSEMMTQEKRLKMLREETGMKRREFAESFGIPLRTVEDWEAGRRKMPEYLFRLMHYKIQIDKLQTKASCEESEKTPRNVNVICDAEGQIFN